MKKVRGQKRYYKKLEFENDLENENSFDTTDSDLFLDVFHLHFDRKGFGNNSFKKRKPHLDKLFRHFDLIEKETFRMKRDFQLYIVLLDKDSSSDAIFINIPNSKIPFPWKFNSLTDKSTLTNINLENYIDGLNEGFSKSYGIAGESFCVLYKKGIGIEPV